MNFEPTINYYGLDFSIEENVVKWNFWEFLKNLILLSSSAKTQKDIIGYGAVADELAEDFNTYYTLQKDKYKEYNLLGLDIINYLNDLDKFFDDRSGHNEHQFWNDEILDKHPDWKKVREMAFEILKKCNYHELEVIIERTTKNSQAEDGTPLMVESTKTKLKRKNAS